MKATRVCPACDDTGWKFIGEGRERRAVRCDCRLQERTQHLLEQARIPKRYQHCDFSTFEAHDSKLAWVKNAAQRYAEVYPVERRGILFVGAAGVGKTHLAVSILKELILTKGVACLFYDYGELLKQIQHSYKPDAESAELDILRPVFDAEVLVLDELGCVKPSEWVWNTIRFVLNTRYNDARTTIFTTNLLDGPAGGLRGGPNGERQSAERAAREETLGDRIGERMWSRLHEMCVIIKVDARDYRLGKGLAG